MTAREAGRKWADRRWASLPAEDYTKRDEWGSSGVAKVMRAAGIPKAEKVAVMIAARERWRELQGDERARGG